MLRRAIRFLRDRSGVAAVEFALIAPVLILMYLGLAEVTMALMAERRAGHATAVVADLVAQDTLTNRAELSDTFAIAEEILSPFAASGMSARVTAIRADDKGVPKVVWSHGKGLTAFAKGSTVSDVPAGLLEPYDTLIMSEMNYSFNSAVKYALPDAMVFREKYYLRPRKMDMVNCTDC
ncbi:TadE/TadG family type IV pilus assembly protein [Phenylobacterium sp.]|uniref:TadE/TadG family type IV pilus assembly protein n=1 Tax=Phenylobacterium sp. TaxID=1871053 RepID=UPI00272FC5FE|nr:TadE/TadG family type IV pilus assembly protein [Phenylobacterium sp.]MDP2215391.1 pilus assembly protein [Phenylobacterium sp.]